MQDAARGLRIEDVRLLLALRTDNVIVIIENDNGVLDHHVLLGHGIAVPCSGSNHAYRELPSDEL